MKRKMQFMFFILGAAGLLAIPDAGLCQGKVLTLDDAVQLAMEKGPGISSAKYYVEAAEHAKKKAFAGFFPVYSTEIRALYYSEKPGISGDMGDFDFDPSLIPPGESDFDDFVRLAFIGMGEMFGDLSSFESKQYDVNITISMTQPLTPLYQVYYGYKLADLGIDVAEIEIVKTREDLAYKVKEAYYSILKLHHGLEAMDEGIASMTAHVQKAELFLQQKVITKNDLLQAKARLAELEAERISMEGTLEIIYEGLNMAVGFPPGTVLVLEEPQKELDEKIPPFNETLKAAMKDRPDMKQIRLNIQQAGLAEKIVIGDFIPQVAAVGTFQHNEGSVMKLPPFAIGGVLSWNFWSFGSKYYSMKETKAKKKAAEEALSAMKSGVAVELKDALAKLKVAIKTLEKAEASVVASEEQLRIENVRYAQNVNTSTEVLDAQARLTQAQLQKTSAKYNIYIAIARLEKATGKP